MSISLLSLLLGILIQTEAQITLSNIAVDTGTDELQFELDLSSVHTWDTGTVTSVTHNAVEYTLKEPLTVSLKNGVEAEVSFDMSFGDPVDNITEEKVDKAGACDPASAAGTGDAQLSMQSISRARAQYILDAVKNYETDKFGDGLSFDRDVEHKMWKSDGSWAYMAGPTALDQNTGLSMEGTAKGYHETGTCSDATCPNRNTCTASCMFNVCGWSNDHCEDTSANQRVIEDTSAQWIEENYDTWWVSLKPITAQGFDGKLIWAAEDPENGEVGVNQKPRWILQWDMMSTTLSCPDLSTRAGDITNDNACFYWNADYFDYGTDEVHKDAFGGTEQRHASYTGASNFASSGGPEIKLDTTTNGESHWYLGEDGTLAAESGTSPYQTDLETFMTGKRIVMDDIGLYNEVNSVATGPPSTQWSFVDDSYFTYECGGINPSQYAWKLQGYADHATSKVITDGVSEYCGRAAGYCMENVLSVWEAEPTAQITAIPGYAEIAATAPALTGAMPAKYSENGVSFVFKWDPSSATTMVKVPSTHYQLQFPEISLTSITMAAYDENVGDHVVTAVFVNTGVVEETFWLETTCTDNSPETSATLAVASGATGTIEHTFTTCLSAWITGDQVFRVASTVTDLNPNTPEWPATISHPTPNPTPSPTLGPTVSPTSSPTSGPTVSPTSSPTSGPTVSPTLCPTSSPSLSPTLAPTCTPTSSPTIEVGAAKIWEHRDFYTIHLPVFIAIAVTLCVVTCALVAFCKTCFTCCAPESPEAVSILGEKKPLAHSKLKTEVEMQPSEFDDVLQATDRLDTVPEQEVPATRLAADLEPEEALPRDGVAADNPTDEFAADVATIEGMDDIQVEVFRDE